MSTVRCTCPNCHGVYRVPDYALDTEHTCPFCKRQVILTACGGRTKLELAGVDGGAKTTLHAPKPGSKMLVLVPEAAVSATKRKWLLGAIAGSIMLAVCCAGCSIGGLIWWAGAQPASSASRAKITQSGRPGIVPAVKNDLPTAAKLETRLAGATMKEVRQTLGDPAEIAIEGQASDPNNDLWIYHNKTRNPETGVPDPDIYIWFRFGRVVHVSLPNVVSHAP